MSLNRDCTVRITIRPNHNMGPFTSYYSKFISFYRYTHTKREGKSEDESFVEADFFLLQYRESKTQAVAQTSLMLKVS